MTFFNWKLNNFTSGTFWGLTFFCLILFPNEEKPFFRGISFRVAAVGVSGVNWQLLRLAASTTREKINKASQAERKGKKKPNVRLMASDVDLRCVRCATSAKRAFSRLLKIFFKKEVPFCCPSCWSSKFSRWEIFVEKIFQWAELLDLKPMTTFGGILMKNHLHFFHQTHSVILCQIKFVEKF